MYGYSAYVTFLNFYLQIRNKLNEQQHSKLAAHHDILNQRHNEMTSMDKRIAELQQRLRTKVNTVSLICIWYSSGAGIEYQYFSIKS